MKRIMVGRKKGNKVMRKRKQGEGKGEKNDARYNNEIFLFVYIYKRK